MYTNLGTYPHYLISIRGIVTAAACLLLPAAQPTFLGPSATAQEPPKPAPGLGPNAGPSPDPGANPSLGAEPGPAARPNPGADPAPTANPTPSATPAPSAAPAPGATPAPGADPAPSVEFFAPGEEIPGDGTEGEADDGPPPPPKWLWRRLVLPPRVAGQLTDFAMHPNNPDLIIVGTQESTILRSEDGGVTWREIELDPYIIDRRSGIMRPPSLPSLGDVTPPGLTIFTDPPFAQEPAQRVSAPFRTLFFAFGPEFMSVRASNNASGFSEFILRDSIAHQPVNYVRRVEICPGGEFEVLAATRDELLGSTDGGLTFVRLLRLPGRVQLYHLACSPLDPNRIYVTTTFGPFISTDGGITFDQDLSGWPGRISNGAAFHTEDPKTVFVATDHVLFRGDPTSNQGLEMCYPDFNNATTAPWTQINWIEVDGDDIWLATDDGIRRSPDGGTNWQMIAPNLFGRHTSVSVTIGQTESGGKRIVAAARYGKPFKLPNFNLPVASDARIASGIERVGRIVKNHTTLYASDDDGETWTPFFNGASERLIQRVKATRAESGHPPRWWAIGGGAIWTTAPLPERGNDVDIKSQRWARLRIAATPPLRTVSERVLLATQLHESFLARDRNVQKRSYLVPSMHLRFSLRAPRPNRREDIAIYQPASILERDRQTNYAGSLTFWWDLPNYTLTKESSGRVDLSLRSARSQIYELGKQIAFIVQDAYRERLIHLRTLARGLSDRLQTEVLKERVRGLEAIIEVWARMPLAETMQGLEDETLGHPAKFWQGWKRHPSPKQTR